MRFRAVVVVLTRLLSFLLVAQSQNTGAASGSVDVLGVKLGATLDQAMAAVKAGNPALVIDVHDSFVVFPGKQVQVHRGFIAHTPRGKNPSYYFGADGAYDVVGVQIAFPPGPQVVEMVSRYVGFANNAPVAKANLLEALRMKYGPETAMDGPNPYWVFDGSGKIIRTKLTPDQMNCMTMVQFNRLDIRDGGGLGAAGAQWDQANEITTNLNSSTLYTTNSAKCLPYTIVKAELALNTPDLAGGFMVTALSPGIAHNGMAATNAAIRGEIDKLAQQQKDAASKRGPGKL